QACGDKKDIKKAEDSYNKAYVAFFDAVKKYVMDWSPRAYHAGTTMNDATRKQMEDNFRMDRDTVVRELEKLRGVNTDPAKCPVKHKKKVYSEDDPRYMEDYQPPPKAPHTPKPSNPQDGPPPYPYYYPPPGSGDAQTPPPPQPYGQPPPNPY